MTDILETNATPMGAEERIDHVLGCLAENNTETLEQWIADEHKTDIALVLESLPPTQREQVWELVPEHKQADILNEVGEVVLASLVEDMSANEIASITGDMPADELVDLLDYLPEALAESVKAELSDEIRERVEHHLSFDEGTAGRLMSSDVISVRSDVSLEVVIRYLRKRGELPDNTDSLTVVNRQGQYEGRLALQDLLTHQDETLVSDVMTHQDSSVIAAMPEDEVAALFEDRDLLSVVVVDEQNMLLGRITVDDVVDIIREHADHQVMGMAGLDEEEDLFAPVIPSARRRAVWLGINLVTAFLASWVIGQFQGALDKLVALAVLMPIVASMGGIAGSQTLTLVIRGQALGQIGRSNLRWLLKKEVLIGMLNGLLWAVVVAIIAWLWFKDAGIATVLGVAIVLNLIAAAASGLFIPHILKRFGIDPALSGSVILTTVTDVVGFMSFLGLATLFLL